MSAGPKIVHISQSNAEGGANRAAYRIHKALQRLGFSSIFQAGRKHGEDQSVVPAVWPGTSLAVSDLSAYLNAAVLKLYPGRPYVAFSPVRLTYGHLDRRLIAGADVVMAHWLSGGFLNFRELLSIHKPIVWRLSDIWPFSGGCHYPGECAGFEARCGACPQLGSYAEHDLSRLDFRARARTYPRLDLTIVAPSRWIAGMAQRSALFGERRIEHIPTGIDLATFSPRPREESRARWGLPQSGRIIGFGALAATEDPRKGYPHLVGALERLPAASKQGVTLAVFGGPVTGGPETIAGMAVRHLGHVGGEDDLASVYSAIDVLVAPFLEDNLPNVVLESLACGTPVAAFRVGGVPDAITHELNGYLAAKGDEDGLAQGISWLLEESGQGDRLRRAAREVAVQRFDLEACARRYGDLCGELAARV